MAYERAYHPALAGPEIVEQHVAVRLHRTNADTGPSPYGESWPEADGRLLIRSPESGHLLVELSMASLRPAHPSCNYLLIAERAAIVEATAEHDPAEDWLTRVEQVSTALATAISKKISKSYSIRTSLKNSQERQSRCWCCHSLFASSKSPNQATIPSR